MGKIIIPPNNDWGKQQAKDLLDAIEGLNYEGRGKWEITFLDDMKEKVFQDEGFSQGQIDKLSEIYRRASGG